MKTVLILPAYNAAKSLQPFLKSLPSHLFDSILLVDDCSRDATFAVAKKQKNILAYQTLRNLGYGGNLKMCFSLALEMGADVVIELHPDGEYMSDAILPALEAVKNGAMVVLGNRFTKETDPLRSGMFVWKYPVLRTLNILNNFFLRSTIPDLHQGFRVYTKETLRACDYRQNANDFLFSFQIIVQSIYHGLQIESVPVGTKYTGKKRGAKLGLVLSYPLKTFWVIFGFWMAQIGMRRSMFAKPEQSVPRCVLCRVDFYMRKKEKLGKFIVYFCDQCQIGSTYPQPQNAMRYYPRDYWEKNSFSGTLKRIVFGLFQRRRVGWVLEKMQKGDVLDVGSGEGVFEESLPKSFSAVSLDVPGTAIMNQKVMKKDFLSWKTAKRFDAITFWESLEHVPTAKQYVEKAYALLKPGGYLFIELPRYHSFESRLFGSHWFHLDLPRHTFHFTPDGIQFLLQRAGFKDVSVRQVLAWEYAPWGIVASILTLFSLREEGRWVRRSLLFVIVLPILPVAGILSFLLYFFGQSPIMFSVGKKYL